MWQLIVDARALAAEARINDYLFCSVFEDGLDRDWNVGNVYIITQRIQDNFMLMSLATGIHTIIHVSQFKDRFWWFLKTPALTKGFSNVHSRIIMAACNKYQAVLDPGVKNYPCRPQFIH